MMRETKFMDHLLHLHNVISHYIQFEKKDNTYILL